MKNSCKKIFGFLTAVIVTASFVGCTTEKTQNISSETSTENSADTTEATEKVTEKATEKATDAPKNTVKRAYNELFSDRDKSAEYGDITAEIKLNGKTVTIEGDGAKAENSTITSTKEGIYRLSGSLDDGQIIVDADRAKVQLVLDNADITCKNSSPIYGKNSDKIFVTLAENSVNSLTDGSSYNFADEQNSEPDACIFSCDSITLNGTGKLSVNANFADGIHSKDDIVITGGDITVNSIADGIKGKDYTAVCGGKIDITSGEDGIKSTETDTALGFVYIEGGDISINAANDGIQAESDAVIADGAIDIICGGGMENAQPKQNDMGFGGRFGGDFTPPEGFENMTPPDGFGGDFTPPEGFENMTPPDGFENMTPPDGFGGGNPKPPQVEQTADSTATETSDTTASDSTKGVKGGNSVEINGGEITVNSADDAIHSNKDIMINGGKSVLSAGGDGIHADSRIDITSGTVTITDSYEGIEGAVINISGGETAVTSSDDGFNATDGQTQQGGMGTYSNGVELNISGGLVYVDSQGDGLDSNGNMTIDGGTVLVNGPTNSGNGALDSNGEILVNGGILAAAGSSGMAESPSEESAQYCVSAGIGSTQTAGTLVALIGENGDILSFAPTKTFDHIVISTPEIQKGMTYSLEIGGSSAAENVYGLYEKGGYDKKGTTVGSFTAENIVSYVGERSAMGGFGGGRGNKGEFGGRNPREDFQPTTDENGNPVIPERDFKRGDFQPATDETGSFIVPEKPQFPYGSDRDYPV